MPGNLVVKAFVANQRSPSFTATYNRDRFILTYDPPNSPLQKYDRLELYENGDSPLLVIPVVKCKFGHNSAPGTSSETMSIDAQMRNCFDTSDKAQLDIKLLLSIGRKGQPASLTKASFEAGGILLGDIYNFIDPNHKGTDTAITIGELTDILASGVALKTGVGPTFLTKVIHGGNSSSRNYEIKLVRVGRRPHETGSKQREPSGTPTLQFAQSGTMAGAYTNPDFGLEIQQGDHITYTQRPPQSWLERSGDFKNQQPWSLTIDVPAIRGYTWWNLGVAEPYLKALRKVKAGAPLSVMPVMSGNATGSWRLAFRVLESPAQDLDRPAPGDFHLQAPILVPLGEDTVQIRMPQLRPHEGDLVINGVLKADGPTEPDDLDQNNLHARVDFKFDATGATGDTESRVVRLGAFDLELSEISKDLDSSAFQATFKSDGGEPEIDRISLLTNLALIDAVPAGQDDLPASEFLPEGFSTGCSTDEDSTACANKEEALENKFRREPPLILGREGESAPAAETSSSLLWLNCVETTRQDTSQTVRVSLRAKQLKSSEDQVSATQSSQQTGAKPAHSAKDVKIDAGAGGSKSTAFLSGGANSTSQEEVFVLDRDPFLLAMVRYTPVRALQNEVKDTQEIAWWTNASVEGAAWHVVSKFGRFDLILPPQVVGEAMLKGKEIGETDLVPFRLAPPATQTLEASYTPQQFVEVPWNLRRLLGFAGQRDPGAGIVELQYELLYGLACVAKPSEMLRFAEIFSTVGRIPGMLPPFRSASSKDDTQIVEMLRRDWADLYRRYKSRLAVFEVRRPGANFGRTDDVSKDPPEVLSLSDGVQCTLRQNADLYYPAWGTKPADSQCDQGSDDEFNVCSDGLKGGATWGFEAPRLYHATVRNPRSDSARLTGPYFSALGGWGFQKVTFDNNRTTIYSHTAMGRVFSYSLERIGRIANYGNLAKHVIQYERSVEPSAQFASYQNPLEHRPVVRKTREFVEILESEADLRKQQENPAGGFVRKVIFKTTIIPVLSEWASNVGDTGWKVPLWNRAQALKKGNESIYPLPEIVFDVINGPGTAQASCGILEPDKLFFYTDTQKDGSSDPHAWPLIPWLDFPPIPQPTCRPGFTSNSTNEELQTDHEVPPGFRMFTYAVEKLDSGVNLLDGRSDRAVAALVQNITVARSAVISQWDKALEPANILVRTAQDKYAKLQELCAQGQAGAEKLKAFATDVCNDNTWTSALDALGSRLDQEAASLMLQVDQRETELFRKFSQALNNAFANLNEEIAAEFKGAWQGGVAPTKEALEKLADAEVELFSQRLNTLHARISGVRGALVGARDAITRFSNDYQQQYKDTVQKLIDLAGQGSTSFENLRTTFSSTVVDAQHRWTSLNSQISASFSSWIPYSSVLIDQVLKPLQTGFSTEVGVIDEELKRPGCDLAIISDHLGKLRDLPFPAMPASLDAALDTDLSQEFFCYLTDRIRITIEGLIPDPPPLNPGPFLDEIRKNLAPEQITKLISTQLSLLEQGVKSQVAAAETCLKDTIKGALLIKQPLSDLKSQLELFCKSANEFSRLSITKWLRELESAATRAFEAAAEGLKNSISANALAQAADTPLRLMRAFGQPPQLPNLDFSLPQLAYYYHPDLPTLDITPVLTEVKQLGPALEKIGSALNPIGTHLPSVRLFDHFIPPSLPAFNLSSIFPDFGGLKLENLFPNLRMPAESTDKVKITHGADQTTRTAWIAADVDFTTDTSATLFSFGPMALALPAARFRARVEMTASQRGIERRSKGSISGNWQLLFGGTSLVTLRDTALTFDDGGLHFNVAPEKVELSSVLNFISTMLASVTSSGNGFVAAPTPTGFEARLDLPIPDISLGTFGISNLSLRNSFALDVAGDFKLKVGFSLASRQAPFNLTIFVLGGGGFIETSAEYTPSTGSLACSAHIGITAGASLAIALGPISGGIYAFVGITIDFEAGGSQARGLAIGAMLLIRGQVSILSIVTAYVAIGLELSYSSGQLVGHGYFSISIKICWCFTLSVSQSITFTLGSGSSRSALPSEPIYLASLLPEHNLVRDIPAFLFPDVGADAFDAAADEYVSMFAEDAA